jgi:hypothetical protein
MRIELMPVSTSTPEMHGGNFAPLGISDRSTARMRAERKPEQYTPAKEGPSPSGERLATVNRHSGYTVLKASP